MGSGEGQGTTTNNKWLNKFLRISHLPLALYVPRAALQWAKECEGAEVDEGEPTRVYIPYFYTL